VPTAEDADRASGILFNVKPNGEWLALRYNDTENNVALWEFHNGIRRNLGVSERSTGGGIYAGRGSGGLWSKTDSKVYFKDYVISAKP
jgi:hypothetical protein